MSKDLWEIDCDRAREELYLDGDEEAFRSTMRRLGLDEIEIEAEIASIVEDDAPHCDRCNNTGRITVRTTYPMSYVCAGEPPEYARGVTGADCRHEATP